MSIPPLIAARLIAAVESHEKLGWDAAMTVLEFNTPDGYELIGAATSPYEIIAACLAGAGPDLTTVGEIMIVNESWMKSLDHTKRIGEMKSAVMFTRSGEVHMLNLVRAGADDYSDLLTWQSTTEPDSIVGGDLIDAARCLFLS